MKLILTRENVVQFLETKGGFTPKIYTKASTFKNEYYILESIKDGIAKYKFMYERSHEDNSFIRIFDESN